MRAQSWRLNRLRTNNRVGYIIELGENAEVRVVYDGMMGLGVFRCFRLGLDIHQGQQRRRSYCSERVHSPRRPQRQQTRTRKRVAMNVARDDLPVLSMMWTFSVAWFVCCRFVCVVLIGRSMSCCRLSYVLVLRGWDIYIRNGHTLVGELEVGRFGRGGRGR